MPCGLLNPPLLFLYQHGDPKALINEGDFKDVSLGSRRRWWYHPSTEQIPRNSPLGASRSKAPPQGLPSHLLVSLRNSPVFPDSWPCHLPSLHPNVCTAKPRPSKHCSNTTLLPPERGPWCSGVRKRLYTAAWEEVVVAIYIINSRYSKRFFEPLSPNHRIYKDCLECIFFFPKEQQASFSGKNNSCSLQKNK